MIKRIAFSTYCFMLLLSSSARGATSSNSTLIKPFVAQGLEGGIWRLDGTFESNLTITNILSIAPLTVTPTLFMQDGTELRLAPVTIAPSSVASININDAVSHAPVSIKQHISAFGAVGLTYQGPWVGSLLSSVKNVDEVRRITFVSHLHSDTVIVHDKTSLRAARAVEGLWWRQTDSTGGFLTLTDTAVEAISANVQFFDAAGAVAFATQVQIPRHGTALLDLGPIFDQMKTRQGTFRVTYTGPSYGLSVEGGLEDDAAGYSAEVVTTQIRPETENGNVSTLSYDSAGIMTGKPEPEMQFPAGTEFSPYAVVANRTDRALIVAVSAAFQQASSPIEWSLPDIHLAPHATLKTDIAAQLKAAGLDPSQYVNLRFSFSGKAGDILLATGSVDDSNDFVFQVPPAIEVKSNSKIICYWQVFNDTSSMISVWNYPKSDQDFILTLSYSGGSYRMPIALAAGESRTIDVGKLIHQQTPDANGKTIPSSVTQGSAMLSGPKGEGDLMEVASSASIFNVRTATCDVTCTSCNGITYAYLNDSPLPLSVGSAAQGVAMMGFQTGGSQEAYSYNWSTSNAAVATVSTYGLAQGMASGSVNLAFNIGADGYSGAGYSCVGAGPYNCPPPPFQGEGGATVSPTVTISGPTSLTTTGSIQLVATGNPPNGTCSWQASNTAVTILGGSTCTATVSASGLTTGYSVLTVTYTVGEMTGTASQTEMIIAAPDHVAVVVDSEGIPDVICPRGQSAVYIRQMQMQVVDINSAPLNYNVSIRESFSNYSAPKACPNTGQATPASCGETGYTDDTGVFHIGQFLDTMAVIGGGNSNSNSTRFCANFNPNLACGFSLTSTWSACSNGSTKSLWTSPRITLSNSATVNGNSSEFPAGTQLH